MYALQTISELSTQSCNDVRLGDYYSTSLRKFEGGHKLNLPYMVNYVIVDRSIINFRRKRELLVITTTDAR